MSAPQNGRRHGKLNKTNTTHIHKTYRSRSEGPGLPKTPCTRPHGRRVLRAGCSFCPVLTSVRSVSDWLAQQAPGRKDAAKFAANFMADQTGPPLQRAEGFRTAKRPSSPAIAKLAEFSGLISLTVGSSGRQLKYAEKNALTEGRSAYAPQP